MGAQIVYIIYGSEGKYLFSIAVALECFLLRLSSISLDSIRSKTHESIIYLLVLYSNQLLGLSL